MNAQMDLETYVAREEARRGMEQAAQSAGDEWKQYALLFLRDYLRQNETLFVDDLGMPGYASPKAPGPWAQ